MFALGHRSRTAILASSAGCFLAAVAIAPLSARSAAPPSLAVARVPAFATPQPLAPEMRVAPRRDPFIATQEEDPSARIGAPQAHPAPVVAAGPVPPIPAGGRTALPPNAGAGNAIAMLGVHEPGAPLKNAAIRAVIVGAHPYAIVDDGQTTKLVGIGGSIDGKRVARIGIGGVSLAGGEHLALSTDDRASAEEVQPQMRTARAPQIIVLPAGTVLGASPQPSATPAAVAAPSLAPGSYQPYSQVPQPSASGVPLQPLPEQFGYGAPSYGQPGYRPPAPAPSASAGPSFGVTF